MLELLPENLRPINAHVQQLGWIPPTATLSNPRPAGEGNMNRTLRFDCSGAQGFTSLILKQAVPYGAKYPDIPAPIERGAAEAAFYHTTQNNAVLTRALPRLLGTDKANHLLAFEDLGDATDLVAAYSDQSLAAQLPGFMQHLLAWLGELHRVSPPELANLCMRELNHTHIFDLPLQPNNDLELGELRPVADRFAADTALASTSARPVSSQAVLLASEVFAGSGSCATPSNRRMISMPAKPCASAWL